MPNRFIMLSYGSWWRLGSAIGFCGDSTLDLDLGKQMMRNETTPAELSPRAL
jgi:hypothetical protein